MMYTQYHEGQLQRASTGTTSISCLRRLETSYWTTLHMCCFFAKCSFANVLSALLFLLTSGRNYVQNCLAEWNVTDVPNRTAPVSRWNDYTCRVRQISLSIYEKMSICSTTACRSSYS